ncbi:MAG: nucleotide disphospho-sugar-binding domain-containing protein [Thiohalocapsa sp.]
MGRRLNAAGHVFTVVSNKDIAKQIVPYRFPFYQLSSDDELRQLSHLDPMPRWALGDLLAFLRWIRRRRRICRKSIERDEIKSLLAQLRPNLLWIDIEFHFAIIATANSNIPTVLSSFFFCPFRQPGLPPLHINMMPGRNWYQNITIRILWWWSHMESIGIEWRRRLSLAGLQAKLAPIPMSTKRFVDLASLARFHGYELKRETDCSQWLRPFIYRRLPILCLNARELEFPHARHPNMYYVGPVIGQVRHEPNLDTGSMVRWERFKHERQQTKHLHRPIIYCSLGTFWSADKEFLRRVIEVFRRRPDWDLVLGLGGKLDPDALAPAPHNVVLLKWAPQLDALRLADCAITHAGITTINECIRCKVPMIVYSTRHVDQNGCAARIAFHRLGVDADKDKDAPEQIEQNIKYVLSDETIRQNLAKMYRHLLAYEDANTAVRVLVKLANNRSLAQ